MLKEIENLPHNTVVTWELEDDLRKQIDHFTIVGRKLARKAVRDHSTPFKPLVESVSPSEKSYSFRNKINPGEYEYQVLGVDSEGDVIVSSNIEPFTAKSFDKYPPLPTGLEVTDLSIKDGKLYISVKWDEKDPEDDKTTGYKVYVDYTKDKYNPMGNGSEPPVVGNEYTYKVPATIKEEMDITVYLTAISDPETGGGCRTDYNLVSTTFHTKPIYVPWLEKWPTMELNKVNRTATFTWMYEDIGNLKGFRLYEFYYPDASSTDDVEESILADETSIPSSSRRYTIKIPSNKNINGKSQYFIVPVSIYDTEPTSRFIKSRTLNYRSFYSPEIE